MPRRRRRRARDVSGARDDDAPGALSSGDLAAEALAAGDPTGWFEPLYAATERAGTAPPWDLPGPRPVLEAWATERGLRGEGRRAVVVGAGLGADAEFVASLGFATLGFDVSATAMRIAGERSAHPNARYEVGDLLALPPAWVGAFDLVVESLTVQALPPAIRDAAIAGVSRLVAPGGTLLVVSSARADGEPLAAGPPWPLTRAEVGRFATSVDPPLRIAALDLVAPFWRAELRRESSTFADDRDEFRVEKRSSAST
ncbi:MAG: class SAM-dependent methyltransferase [Conexibacter sp.]|nr:class SAM-dependent methyltransferase [Conexibacter sp.]